jgi:predicted glycosyltransferase
MSDARSIGRTPRSASTVCKAPRWSRPVAAREASFRRNPEVLWDCASCKRNLFVMDGSTMKWSNEVHATDDPIRSAPLVIFQVPNQIGLGHMNRMACVAVALRKIDPAIRLLFVVEGSTHGLLESFALPYIALPNPGLVYRSECWKAWPINERRRSVDALAISIIYTTRPDLVIYDCLPSIHFIHSVIRFGIKTVLCIRKVKDFEAYARDYRVVRVLESAASFLIPHWQDEFQLPDSLMSRATYVGPIVRPLPIDPEPVTVRFNLLEQRIVVISAGGGGGSDTAVFFNFCLSAFQQARTQMDSLAALLITGPLFTNWGELNLLPTTRVIPFAPDFPAVCATADLVVSQAGYNSLNELAALGTPTICIPAKRGFDDQFDRARSMARKYPHISCFERGSAQDLASLILASLRQPTTRVQAPVPDGAHRAALHVMSLLDKEDKS